MKKLLKLGAWCGVFIGVAGAQAQVQVQETAFVAPKGNAFVAGKTSPLSTTSMFFPHNWIRGVHGFSGGAFAQNNEPGYGAVRVSSSLRVAWRPGVELHRVCKIFVQWLFGTAADWAGPGETLFPVPGAEDVVWKEYSAGELPWHRWSRLRLIVRWAWDFRTVAAWAGGAADAASGGLSGKIFAVFGSGGFADEWAVWIVLDSGSAVVLWRVFAGGADVLILQDDKCCGADAPTFSITI